MNFDIKFPEILMVHVMELKTFDFVVDRWLNIFSNYNHGHYSLDRISGNILSTYLIQLLTSKSFIVDLFEYKQHNLTLSCNLDNAL